MTLQPLDYHINWLLWPMWHLLLISCMILKENRVKFQPRIRWIWSCFLRINYPDFTYARSFLHINHYKTFISDRMCKQETIYSKERNSKPCRSSYMVSDRMCKQDGSTRPVKKKRLNHREIKQWALNLWFQDVTYAKTHPAQILRCFTTTADILILIRADILILILTPCQCYKLMC